MPRVILPIAAIVTIGAVLVGGFVAISKLENAAEPAEPSATFGLDLSEATPSNIRSDEQVVFIPTVARLSDDGKRWIVPIHAWVFEPEEGALIRGAAVAALAETFGIDDVDANAIFRERAAWFLVDNERNKRLTIRVGERAFELDGLSGLDGHLRATIELPASINGAAACEAVLPEGDDREFKVAARLLEPTGLTVISDIDDTIKVSHVTDKKKLLAKTFTHEFEAAPGMAHRYREIANEYGAAFVYVSSSPWQLYPALSAFIKDAGFPTPSAYYLKTLRLKDSRALDLLADPFESKVARIETIIADHPRRDYILSGDTGEKDPEVYAAIARAHPGRVKRIMLRNVTGETLEGERLEGLFGELDVPVELIDPE